MTSLQDVFAEWQNNLAFREKFKRNPEQAIKEAGFELSSEDFAKIQAMVNMDKSKDQKLDDRISK